MGKIQSCTVKCCITRRWSYESKCMQHCSAQRYHEFPVHGTTLNSQLTHGVGIWQEMRLEGRKGRKRVGHEGEFRFYLKCVESLWMYLWKLILWLNLKSQGAFIVRKSLFWMFPVISQITEQNRLPSAWVSLMQSVDATNRSKGQSLLPAWKGILEFLL